MHVITYPCWYLSLSMLVKEVPGILWQNEYHYHMIGLAVAGISLGVSQANERRRYNVATSLMGWMHT